MLLSALALGGGAFAVDAVLAALPDLATKSPPRAAYDDHRRAGITPEVFGADGTQNGDSAGLRTALSTDAVAVDLAARTYRLDASALGRLKLSGRALRGVKGQTIIQIAEPPIIDMVSVFDQHDFTICDIVFDGGGLLERRGHGSYPAFRPCLLIENCQRFAVSGCVFVGFESCGMLINVASDAFVHGNRVDRGRSAPEPNYGLAALGGGRRNTLSDNTVKASNIAVDTADTMVTGNDVSGWGFSAGINVAEDLGNARDLLLAFNRCHDSAAIPDRDGFYLDGIECWAPGSLVIANHCHRSIGNGISFGADNMIVAANQCQDNGSLLGGKPVGWGIRALADEIDASRSLVVGNRCGDTRPPAAKRQAFGYGENSDRLAGIELWANAFEGNALAALDIRGLTTRVDGTRSGNFTPRGDVTFVRASGTFVHDRATTRVGMDIALPPTRDASPFAIENLPMTATAYGILHASSARRNLRLVVAPGTRRAVANDASYADLANATLIIAGEYISENL